MEGDYLVIEQPKRHVYFCAIIKKETIDSNIIKLNQFFVYDRDEIFDDTYGGYFLWIDENKDIRIYDNIKKTFFNSDTNQKITFMYDDKKYDCIENTLKEMLFDLFVKLNNL